MTDPARAQTVDTEIAKHCAFSLPGVALTLGRQNWHCLKDTYETLASDVQVGLRWISTTCKKKVCYVSVTLHFISQLQQGSGHMVCSLLLQDRMSLLVLQCYSPKTCRRASDCSVNASVDYLKSSVWVVIFFFCKEVCLRCKTFTATSVLPSLFQWKVRRTLAFSIHELAVILGDQLTAADLVPIFNGFLKDLDEVRIGVLKHLYDFLKVSLEM